MKIDRRRALALLGLGGAAGSQGALAASPATLATFEHGVASGDPLADRLVIWTRATPAQADAGRFDVLWEVASDTDFRAVVRQGRAAAGPDRDYTVKVDVTGLKPGVEYFYRFRVGEAVSAVGRARTLPQGGIKDVVLAVASCTLYPNGYFNAYEAIAALPRVDAVLHLGDYIYEYGGPGSYGMDSKVAGERPHEPPREVVSLTDYRRRHAQYKSDPQLQAAHARAPWIVAWDDHETANDSWVGGAENHSTKTEGEWAARKAAALKAYYEWMPIREPGAGQDLVTASERSFHFGDLASLIMIETRLGARDKQLDFEDDAPKVDGKVDLAAWRAKIADPARRMMNDRQEAWIGRELKRSVKAGHAWQVIGNQVLMARIAVPDPTRHLAPEVLAAQDARARRRMDRMVRASQNGLPWTLDSWDGYPVDRERLYGLFRQAGARPVVLAGDSHCFWTNDLHDDAGRRVACEFGTTGVTSPSGGDYVPGVDLGKIYADANSEVVWNNQSYKGFVLLTLTHEGARAEMMGVSTITERSFTTATLATFEVRPEGSGLTAPVKV
ncbi:alkaline phosphatase D family protein [Phenylobacterium deserti]|uniref:Alkaline phosphatase n=1 Tax=Phenylobacterium deserti TaxID=1914756 RepID=A0A328AS90_9CAUL|nr:alkaline phosphatase D family protein [Phenylobacterium deserti]RAK57830.1 alkaline phosphatase [Phenylobacterium deserti]